MSERAMTWKLLPDTEAVLLRRIAVASAVLAGLTAALGAVREGGVAAFSVVLGAGVGILNLWVLARLVVKILSEGPDGAKARAAILLVVKMFALFAVVGVLLSQSWVAPGWFLGGITATVVGIAVGGLWGSLPPTEGPRGD